MTKKKSLVRYNAIRTDIGTALGISPQAPNHSGFVFSTGQLISPAPSKRTTPSLFVTSLFQWRNFEKNWRKPHLTRQRATACRSSALPQPQTSGSKSPSPCAIQNTTMASGGCVWQLTKHPYRCRFIRLIRVRGTDTLMPSYALNLPFCVVRSSSTMDMSAKVVCWHPAPMRLMPARRVCTRFCGLPALSLISLISLVSTDLCSQVLRPTPISPTFELLPEIWRREMDRSCREPQTCTTRQNFLSLLHRKKCVSYVKYNTLSISCFRPSCCSEKT